jgi:translation elongation factor EF-G
MPYVLRSGNNELPAAVSGPISSISHCVSGPSKGSRKVDAAEVILQGVQLVVDGKSHDVDSSRETFELAGWECTRDAQLKAGITLLEPIMNVVVAPENYQGTLAGNINRHRGEILNFLSDKGRCSIHAYIPLAELFGYTSDLRNVTSGMASFTMEPSHYAPVREELSDIRKAS